MRKISLLPFLMVLLLWSCSNPEPGPPPGLATPPANTAPPVPPRPPEPGPGSPPPAVSAGPVKLVEITVSGRSVSPPPGRVEVKQGEQVRMVIHSDTPDEVHVHGYDLEKPVGPGQDAVIEFAATQTGLFEVETHDSGLLLTQLAVR